MAYIRFWTLQKADMGFCQPWVGKAKKIDFYPLFPSFTPFAPLCPPVINPNQPLSTLLRNSVSSTRNKCFQNTKPTIVTSFQG